MRGKRRADTVAQDERRKAEFIGEFATLCRRHGMLPAVLELDGEEYKPYVVLDCEKHPEFIDRVVQELNVTDVFTPMLGGDD